MARPKSDIDDRILRAARARFLVEGVDGASLRSIADDAKTSVGMVYYYFPTKDALFLAVVEQTYGALLADIGREIGAYSTTEARLRCVYHRLARLSDDEHSTIRLILREALVSSERRAHIVERSLRGHVPLVLAALADGVGRGEVATGFHPMSLGIGTILLGIVPQVMRRLVAEGNAELPVPTAEQLADDLLRVLFSGIRGPASTSPSETPLAEPAPAKPVSPPRRRRGPSSSRS